MSIDTLLEAARFLEWQAQQQTREENEKHEKLCQEREQEQKKSSVQRVNHATQPEESRNDLQAGPLSPPTPAPPPPLPPSLAAPISIIPIPVVTSPPQPAPQSNLSPPLIQRHSPLVNMGLSKEPPLMAPVIQKTSGSLLPPDIKPPTPSSASPSQLPHYATSVLAISPHHMAQPPIKPQPPTHQPLLPHHVPPPLSVKANPSEEAKPSEQKKRPGGVGTREVHNKLEKNRRAHLKECFETLKRNIPNVDDKKTSNLSVLRSALRYIQLVVAEGILPVVSVACKGRRFRKQNVAFVVERGKNYWYTFSRKPNLCQMTLCIDLLTACI